MGYRKPSLDWVFQTYRLRFAIESTYRQLHERRIRTMSRARTAVVVRGDRADLAERLGVVALYAPARPRRGGREILSDLLRLETLLQWLLHVVEVALGVADVTRAPKGCRI